jgi:hypothetical protein
MLLWRPVSSQLFAKRSGLCLLGKGFSRIARGKFFRRGKPGSDALTCAGSCAHRCRPCPARSQPSGLTLHVLMLHFRSWRTISSSDKRFLFDAFTLQTLKRGMRCRGEISERDLTAEAQPQPQPKVGLSRAKHVLSDVEGTPRPQRSEKNMKIIHKNISLSPSNLAPLRLGARHIRIREPSTSRKYKRHAITNMLVFVFG